MSFRISIINNSNQKQQSIFLYKKDSSNNFLQTVLKVAKQKLRIKAPSRVFNQFGADIESDYEPTDNMTVYISAGEDYIGADTNGTKMEQKTKAAEVRILAKASFVEDSAIKQLENTSALPGITIACGMPDLHPGKIYPIGATFISEDYVYPALIGGDIGCGMKLLQLKMKSNITPSKLASKLHSIEGTWSGDKQEYLKSKGVSTTPFDDSLGTIGGGNHFAEVQVVEKIINETAFSELDIDANSALLLVHSGSRGFGQSILDEHIQKFKNNGLAFTSTEAQEYLQKHNHACNWARANRQLISDRILDQLGVASKGEILDIWHNNISIRNNLLIHRKGAAPTEQGLIVLPGSRGSFSYLLKAKGDQERNCWSVAHGAGRKWTRTKANTLIREKYLDNLGALETTSIGSAVICEDKELLFEEAPEAYKNVEEIVKDLEDFVDVVCVFRPIVTYKTRI